MSDETSQQTSLNEIVGEYSEETNEETDESVDAGKIQEIDESPIEDWELRRLGEVFSLEYGENLTENERDGGQYPVYGSNGQVGSHSESYVNSPGIIVGRKGSIGEVEFSEEPFYPIDTTYYISQDETDENLRFVYYLLQNLQLSRLNAASAIPGLNRNDAYSLKGLILPLNEQRRISSILYNIDKGIQKSEDIISQAERVKEGTMQDLFTRGIQDEDTQELHIGKFPESWDFYKLSEVTNIIRGNTPKTSNEDYYGGDTVWVTPDDLSTLYEEGDGKYISDSDRKLTQSGINSASLTITEPNSVMFTSRSYGIGKTAICTVPAATNQGITAFECGERMNEEFLYYYLNYIMDYIISISGVSTFPEISKSDTSNILAPIPDIETQERIVTTLSDMDERIASEERTKGGLQRLKRGLMQDLLSGKIRTANKDIDVLSEVKKHG